MAQRTDFSVETNLGNVADPVNPQDTATKNYVDTKTGSVTLQGLTDVSVIEPTYIRYSTVTVTNVDPLNDQITIDPATDGIIGLFIRGGTALPGQLPSLRAISHLAGVVTLSGDPTNYFTVGDNVYYLPNNSSGNFLEFNNLNNKWVQGRSKFDIAGDVLTWFYNSNTYVADPTVAGALNVELTTPTVLTSPWLFSSPSLALLPSPVVVIVTDIYGRLASGIYTAGTGVNPATLTNVRYDRLSGGSWSAETSFFVDVRAGVQTTNATVASYTGKGDLTYNATDNIGEYPSTLDYGVRYQAMATFTASQSPNSGLNGTVTITNFPSPPSGLKFSVNQPVLIEASQGTWNLSECFIQSISGTADPTAIYTLSDAQFNSQSNLSAGTYAVIVTLLQPSGVGSLNNLQKDITIAAGSGIGINTANQTITVTNTGSGSGISASNFTSFTNNLSGNTQFIENSGAYTGIINFGFGCGADTGDNDGGYIGTTKYIGTTDASTPWYNFGLLFPVATTYTDLELQVDLPAFSFSFTTATAANVGDFEMDDLLFSKASSNASSPPVLNTNLFPGFALTAPGSDDQALERVIQPTVNVTGSGTSFNAQIGVSRWIGVANNYTHTLATASTPYVFFIRFDNRTGVNINSVSNFQITSGQGGLRALVALPGVGGATPSLNQVLTIGNTTGNQNLSFSPTGKLSGPVTGLNITGGTSNQFLRTDGAGNQSWATVAADSVVTLSDFSTDYWSVIGDGSNPRLSAISRVDTTGNPFVYQFTFAFPFDPPPSPFPAGSPNVGDPVTLFPGSSFDPSVGNFTGTVTSVDANNGVMQASYLSQIDTEGRLYLYTGRAMYAKRTFVEATTPDVVGFMFNPITDKWHGVTRSEFAYRTGSSTPEYNSISGFRGVQVYQPLAHFPSSTIIQEAPTGASPLEVKYINLPATPGVTGQVLGITSNDGTTVNTSWVTNAIYYDSNVDFQYNNVTVSNINVVLSTGASGPTTLVVAGASGTIANAITSYFNNQGQYIVYRFAGNNILFSVQSATTLDLTRCVLTLTQANDFSPVAVGTVLQVQIPNTTVFTDVALGSSLSGAVRTNSLGRSALNIDLNLEPAISVINFVGSATGGANQVFTNASLSGYATADLITVSANGSTLNRSNYSLSGVSLTIIGYLPPNAIVQVQPSNGGIAGGGGGSTVITSPNNTLVVGGTSANSTLDVAIPAETTRVNTLITNGVGGISSTPLGTFLSAGNPTAVTILGSWSGAVASLDPQYNAVVRTNLTSLGFVQSGSNWLLPSNDGVPSVNVFIAASANPTSTQYGKLLSIEDNTGTGLINFTLVAEVEYLFELQPPPPIPLFMRIESFNFTAPALSAIDLEITNQIVAGANVSVNRNIATNALTISSSVSALSNVPVSRLVEPYTTVTATSGAITVNLNTASLFYTSNLTATSTLTISNASTAIPTVGQAFTFTLISIQSATTAFINAISITGSTGTTVRWLFGNPPNFGSSTGADVYQFTVLRTATSTYYVLASRGSY